MGESDVKIMTKEGIKVFVDSNLDNPAFVFFLNSILPKWGAMHSEHKQINSCIDHICNEWECSRDELFYDRKKYEPRGVLFFLIRKNLKLSFEIIGGMFMRHKGKVHKAVSEVSFYVNKNKKVTLLEKIRKVEEVSFTKLPDQTQNGSEAVVERRGVLRKS